MQNLKCRARKSVLFFTSYLLPLTAGLCFFCYMPTWCSDSSILKFTSHSWPDQSTLFLISLRKLVQTVRVWIYQQLGVSSCYKYSCMCVCVYCVPLCPLPSSPLGRSSCSFAGGGSWVRQLGLPLAPEISGRWAEPCGWTGWFLYKSVDHNVQQWTHTTQKRSPLRTTQRQESCESLYFSSFRPVHKLSVQVYTSTCQFSGSLRCKVKPM